MLKRLVIENYRSCVRTSLDLHPSLSVLIGPNGSGKTNILHSVMLLNKLTGRGDTLRSRAPVGGSSRIIASFQVGPGTAQLRVSFDPYKSETSDQRNMFASQKWDLKAQNGNRFSLAVPLAFPAVVGAEWPRVDWRKYYYQRFAVPSRMRLRGKGQHEHIIPLWAARMMLRVAEFCTGIKYYSASQFTNPLSCPASFGIEDGRPPRFFRQRGHVRFLYDMYSAEQSGKDGRFGRFMDIVSPHGLGLIDRLSFQKVRTSSANYSVKVGGKLVVRKSNTLLIIPRFKIGRLILSPNQLSEGTFKTLALLFHVITENSPALLIEEPEVCVHHGLLSSILELIKSHSQRRQVIITTHSDYVLDHVSPENVYTVMFDKKTGTGVRHVTKTMSPQELSALKEYLASEGNLGEYWREGGLGEQS